MGKFLMWLFDEDEVLFMLLIIVGGLAAAGLVIVGFMYQPVATAGALGFLLGRWVWARWQQYQRERGYD